MNEQQVYEKLTEIFRDVFDDNSIELEAKTDSSYITGWDSLMHVTLIGTIEDEFQITFSIDEIIELKNVESLVLNILKQLNNPSI